MAGTLPVFFGSGEEPDGALNHLALARIGQRLAGLQQRDPARLGDLVVVVVGGALDEFAQEESNGLADAPAAPAVPVGDVAELGPDRRGEAGLLAHLAHGGGVRRLVRVRAALG